ERTDAPLKCMMLFHFVNASLCRDLSHCRRCGPGGLGNRLPARTGNGPPNRRWRRGRFRPVWIRLLGRLEWRSAGGVSSPTAEIPSRIGDRVGISVRIVGEHRGAHGYSVATRERSWPAAFVDTSAQGSHLGGSWDRRIVQSLQPSNRGE